MQQERAILITEKNNYDKEIHDLKVSQNNLKTQLRNKEAKIHQLKVKENQRINQELNNSLGLNLPPDANLSQIITVIKKLIDWKPKNPQQPKENTPIKTEDLFTLSEKNLNITKQVCWKELKTTLFENRSLPTSIYQKFQSCQNYPQLAKVCRDLITDEFNRLEQQKNCLSQKIHNTKITVIVLLVLNLITIIGSLVIFHQKLRKKKKLIE